MRNNTASMFFDSRLKQVKRRHEVIKVMLAILITGGAVALILHLAG